MDTKEKLQNELFKISLNNKTDELTKFIKEAKICYKKEKNKDIKDLINITIAVKEYYLHHNKTKVQKYIKDIWNELENKKELNIYEIRNINYIILMIMDIDKSVEMVSKCLNNLENYKKHKKYINLKIGLKFNLSNSILQYKYFNNNNKYTELAIKYIDDIIEENKKNKIDNTEIIFISILRKGILINDKQLIYISILALKNNKKNNLKEIINFYLKTYSIKL